MALIQKIGQEPTLLFWGGFHAILGLLSSFTKWPLVFWFYIILINGLPYLFKGTYQDRRHHILFLVAYLSSFEMISRMATTSPVIPYELSKYLMFFLILRGTMLGRNYTTGWVLFFLLVPAMFFDLSGEVPSYQYIVFNLLGPLSTALGIAFFSKMPVAELDYRRLLRVMLYPLISVLVFTVIKTPDLDKIEFSLGANFETSGGFGANQVSTILGLGAMIAVIFLFFRWPITGKKWIDIGLLFAFIFQGLLTFSRGGVIGSILGILIIVYGVYTSPRSFRNHYKIPSIGKYLIPLSIFAGGLFIWVDSLTGGNLLLRYQGETAGTLAGSKDKSLATLTSSRSDIFEGDMQLWLEHPLFGVGVASSRYLREQLNGVGAHVELSRLLAEHGILGLLYFILLLSMVFNIFKWNKNPIYRSIQVALFVVGGFTSFHSAMRTYVTPLLIGVSLLRIFPEPSLQKKQDSKLYYL